MSVCPVRHAIVWLSHEILECRGGPVACCAVDPHCALSATQASQEMATSMPEWKGT